MRILFITSTRIGDAVLSCGLLGHLLDTYPQARFTIACGPLAVPLFEAMPRRERTIQVEKRRFDAHWVVLWSRLAGVVWDLAVDLRGSAVTYLIPARRRAVLRGGRRPGHKIEQLAGVLGISPPPLPLVWTSAGDDEAAARLLPGEGWIGVGPTANWAGKIWPAERFAELCRALMARAPGARVAVFGGPGAAERAMAAPVLAAVPGAADLVGRVSLPQAAACLRRCRLFVGNDSGLMHLAAAAGTPTLGLFGPTLAREYGPRGAHAAAVLADGPEGAAPMPGLSVSAVLSSALTLLC